MISPEFEEKCDRILSAITSGKEFVIGRDNAGDLFIVIGNDAAKIENWNRWMELKYPSPDKVPIFSFESCAMCNGKGEIANVYGGAAYLCGYSDHGHLSFEKCGYCQQGISLVIENAKNIGAYEE